MPAEDEVIGFTRPRIDQWLAETVQVQLPLTWVQLAGGHSNLTYLVVDRAGGELVVRRPPLGSLLPKAHDMKREYRIIEALWPTPVPVPEPMAYCDDRTVSDTHFYVMGRAPGQVLHGAAAAAAFLDMSGRRRAGPAFFEVLAAVHALDPAEIGLSDLGRPDGYLARQLQTWHRSWIAQVPQADLDDQRAHDLYDALAERAPEQGPGRLVHGDYGPHNTMFLANGEVAAVLDWEIATLGDPLADFAYSLNAWVGPGDDPVDLLDPATVLPGFATRQAAAQAYVDSTGADMRSIDYYRSFNFWKRACIVHGVYARYRSGQKSADGVDVPMLARRIDKALSAAVDALQGS